MVRVQYLRAHMLIQHPGDRDKDGERERAESAETQKENHWKLSRAFKSVKSILSDTPPPTRSHLQ